MVYFKSICNIFWSFGTLSMLWYVVGTKEKSGNTALLHIFFLKFDPFDPFDGDEKKLSGQVSAETEFVRNRHPA
jgi:hypothetical protein